MSNLGHITEYDADCRKLDKKPDEDKTVIRLDLACGNNKKEGYQGVDVVGAPDTQADIVIDLENYPWPFETSSVFEIHCSHYIEHTSDIKRFMEEIYRILIPGGRVTFYAPYYSSIRAMQDLTHKRFISESTFLYFNREWMQTNKLEHYGIKCNFAILSTKFLFNIDWKLRSIDAQEWARKHNINVVDDIEAILQAVKTEDKDKYNVFTGDIVRIANDEMARDSVQEIFNTRK